MSVLQYCLFDLAEEPSFEPLTPARTLLTDGAWIDVQRGWLDGSGEVFRGLLDQVPWRAERRRMYDKTVDVPRLLCFYGEGAPLPSPALTLARDRLNAYYADEEFVTAGMCLYRDGRDSVAWHGDTIGRGATQLAMVAILSLGAPRPLLLRPRAADRAAADRAAADPEAAGRARRYELGHGDLLVMGGSCQRTWEHAIPKISRPCGPRISVQFRPRDVR